jgi:hypothetical protein
MIASVWPARRKSSAWVEVERTAMVLRVGR